MSSSGPLLHEFDHLQLYTCIMPAIVSASRTFDEEGVICRQIECQCITAWSCTCICPIYLFNIPPVYPVSSNDPPGASLLPSRFFICENRLQHAHVLTQITPAIRQKQGRKCLKMSEQSMHHGKQKVLDLLGCVYLLTAHGGPVRFDLLRLSLFALNLLGPGSLQRGPRFSCEQT